MGRSQRTKGAAGEREAAALLSDELGLTVQRRLGQARDAGLDLHIGDHLAIEVKRQERASIGPWLDQARAGADGRIPVVMWRPSRRGWCFVMDWESGIYLMRESL